MVFPQGPLSLGDSFGNEARNASVTFSPMETAAHPRTLFKRRTFGKMIATLTSFTSLWTGVVKNFRCGTSAISNRTWACIDCGKTYRRVQTVDAVNCAHCGDPCERLPWKVRVPSPKNRKEWDAFWTQYRMELRQLQAWRSGTLAEPTTLKILNMQLNVRS